MATSLELNGPKSIRRAELSVLADGPLLGLDVISGEATLIFLILKNGDTGSEAHMLADQTPTATPMGVFGAGYDVNTFSFIKCSFYPGFLSLQIPSRQRLPGTWEISQVALPEPLNLLKKATSPLPAAVLMHTKRG